MLEALRDGDNDRYVSTLYAPAAKRGDLVALYAFNLEIARISELVREPLAGEIRLQWWRDALASTSRTTGHPAADALKAAMERNGLPFAAFDHFLEARLFDLYHDPMPDRAALEAYCGETASALIQLAALVLDAKAAPSVADCAGHAGCAQGIAELLARLDRHVAQGRCPVPGDILAAAGTDVAAFLAESDAPKSRVAVEAMIALGREHARDFERLARDLPKSLRPAFLPAGLASQELGRLGSGRKPPGRLRRQWWMLNLALGGWN